MYRILPVDDNDDIPPIAWPKEVQLSPVPDWPKTVAQLQKRRADEKKKKKAQNNEDAEIGKDTKRPIAIIPPAGENPQEVVEKDKEENEIRDQRTNDYESDSEDAESL
jgi:hypothetical protein